MRHKDERALNVHAAAICLVLVGALSGCKDGALQFHQTAQVRVNPNHLNMTDACTADSSLFKTEARLVNTVLRSGVMDNALTYEIAMIACDGTHQPISDQPVYFAINAEIGEHVVSEFIAANGSEDVQGKMLLVEGEDFFGARGSEFFHHRTEKVVSMVDTSSDTALQFTINFGGQRFYPVGGGNRGRFTTNTFVKVGDAIPAVQTVDVIP